METQYFALTATQSRILLALFSQGETSGNGVMHALGISVSTFAKEKRELLRYGLIDARKAREFSAKGIHWEVRVFLTAKGEKVATNLASVSDAMKGELVIA